MDKMKYNVRGINHPDSMNMQEKAFELLSTYNNKQDFLNIMKHIDRQIMGGDLLSDEEIEIEEEHSIPNNNPGIKYYQRSTTPNSYEPLNKPIRNEFNNKLHKKYTDVHANSKYYYPEGYNDDDLEPSQWNDRSNRNNYYNRNNNEPTDHQLYYKDINNYKPRKDFYK